MQRKTPKYTLHKSTGQARVIVNGKHHYLGEYGSPESRERYEDLVAEWFTSNGDLSSVAMTIDELCLLFIDFAKTYYRRRDGSETGTLSNVREALRYPVEHFGTSRIRDFGPRRLKSVRDAMIADGRCRTNINRLVHWVRRAFRWGVENEFVPVEVYTALQTVSSLQPGRSEARESDPVRPVDAEVVRATLEFLPAPVAAMVQLQLLTGSRPGEITTMRPTDVDTNGDVWTYQPSTHKTEHRGKSRRIHIGPQAQEILRPFLDRDAESYCFSPKEAQNSRRVTQPRYNKDSYNKAVCRGCERAFGMPTELRRIPSGLSDAEKAELKRLAKLWRAEHCWSPGQLRHTRATLIRERYGIEAAQVVLGHSDPRITEVYAERDFQKAADIMSEIG